MEGAIHCDNPELTISPRPRHCQLRDRQTRSSGSLPTRPLERTSDARISRLWIPMTGIADFAALY